MTQWKWPFRLQFSLLGFLVGVLVISLAISHWNTSRRLQETELKLRELRDQLAHLSIDDPIKFHAISVETDDEHTWKWLLFIPKGARYQWNLACENIPQNAPPAKAGVIGISNEPYWEQDNEVLVTARLQRADDGNWTLSVTSKIGNSRNQMSGAALQIPAEKLEWMTSVPATDGRVIGSKGTEVLESGQPIILLQKRACEIQPSGDYLPSAGPMPGFMIWLSPW